MKKPGSGLAVRARSLEAECREILSEAGNDFRKKEAEKVLNFLDGMARNTYKLSRDLESIPQGMGSVKKGTLRIAAPVFDLALAKMEGRILALKKGKSMAGAIKPTMSDFFPEGEFYDWYNPADWLRQAEYSAALAEWNALNMATMPLDAAGGVATGAASAASTEILVSVLKIGAGIIALKMGYDFLKKKKGN